MSSSITLYDDAGNPVVLDGNRVKVRELVNVVGSRTMGSTYTNNTGAEIQVLVNIQNSVSTATRIGLSAFIDGEEVQRAAADTTYSAISVNITVPSGSTYIVNNFGSSYTTREWYELRGD